MTGPHRARGVERDEAMMLIRERIAQAWRAAGHDEAMPDIGDDDNLFDLGVVDSLTMVELVVYVESMSGSEPIDLLAVDPELFFTLAGMWKVVQERQAAN